MVWRHHHHESAGLPRRVSSKHSRNHSNASSSGDSVLSRVLNFRQKRREGKKKILQEPAKQQDDWSANYKGTHHPDRPRLDKRIRTVLPDDQYAAKLERMQEKSEKHYAQGERSGSMTSPPPRPQRSFSHASKSPKGRRILSPPTSVELERRPSKQHDDMNRTQGSSASPGARTPQENNATGLDRGRIVRHIAQTDPMLLLPKTASDPDESSTRSSPRESFYKRKRSSSEYQSSETTHRHSRKSTIYENPNATTTGFGLAVHSPARSPRTAPPSPPASPKATPTSPPPADKDKDTKSRGFFPEPVRMCPWPGCNAVLATTQEKEGNLCTTCREALCPRESTFFDPRPSKPPVVKDEDLDTLKAVVGTRVSIAENVRIRGHPRGSAKLVDSKFSISGFKLGPPPLGKGPRPSQVRRSEDENMGGQASPSHSSSPDRSKHIGFQDVRWSPPSPKMVKKPLTILHLPMVEENSEREHNGSDRSRSPDTNGGSWTTDSLSTESSDGESASHRAEPHSPPHSPPHQDSLVAPLARQNSSSPPHQGRAPSAQLVAVRETHHRQPSRDSILYREIEDIIDCYTLVEENSDEEKERRKASTIASFFEKEPEAVEMRKKGFI
ncbi:hypothetical protein F4804DRAFT_352340 [Jackrogersella minutella]|nr:hypothetical protein F4804DRAFT_352340 [Jackrogersella minutella]